MKTLCILIQMKELRVEGFNRFALWRESRFLNRLHYNTDNPKEIKKTATIWKRFFIITELNINSLQILMSEYHLMYDN